MSGPVKRRDVQQEVDDAEDQSAEEDEEQVEEMILEQEGMQIQVDFEGRNPQDPDYHGIKTLLQQLFLKAHVDLGGLTDLIISQNYVGSVVTQAEDDLSDDEESSGQEVFGITTAVNISERQNVPCIKQLRDLLKQHAVDHATDATNTMIKKVLENDGDSLGLLINERFINIPAQISVPILENLVNEVKRASQKKMPFDFSYYIMICKMKKAKEDKKKSKNKKKNAEEPDVIWSNPEEELFAEEAVCSFEFSVETETGKGVSGTWDDEDDALIPYRRVLLLEASKLPAIINKIKSNLA